MGTSSRRIIWDECEKQGGLKLNPPAMNGAEIRRHLEGPLRARNLYDERRAEYVDQCVVRIWFQALLHEEQFKGAVRSDRAVLAQRVRQRLQRLEVPAIIERVINALYNGYDTSSRGDDGGGSRASSTSGGGFGGDSIAWNFM